MLIYAFHLGLSLQLLALAAGAAILIWSKMQQNIGTSLTKLIAYIIIILAALSIVCGGYHAIKFWSQGYFDRPFSMLMQHQMMPGGGMMMQRQMMQEKMQQNKMPTPATENVKK